KLVWVSFKQRKYFNMIFRIFLFILLFAILTGVFKPLKELWANLLSNEYFFPEFPIAVVESIDLRFNEGKQELVGHVVWKQQYKYIDVDNYRVLAYLKYSNDSLYKTYWFYRTTYDPNYDTELARISTDGSFLVTKVSTSFNMPGNVLQGFIVAIVTRLDDGLRKRYPAGVYDKNATQLNAIGAFTEELDVSGTQP